MKNESGEAVRLVSLWERLQAGVRTFGDNRFVCVCVQFSVRGPKGMWRAEVTESWCVCVCACVECIHINPFHFSEVLIRLNQEPISKEFHLQRVSVQPLPLGRERLPRIVLLMVPHQLV